LAIEKHCRRAGSGEEALQALHHPHSAHKRSTANGTTRVAHKGVVDLLSEGCFSYLDCRAVDDPKPPARNGAQKAGFRFWTTKEAFIEKILKLAGRTAQSFWA
jgi:hypothetical protein